MIMVVSVPFNVNTDYKVETKSYTQSKGETKKNKQLEDQRHTKYLLQSVNVSLHAFITYVAQTYKQSEVNCNYGPILY